MVKPSESLNEVLRIIVSSSDSDRREIDANVLQSLVSPTLETKIVFWQEMEEKYNDVATVSLQPCHRVVELA